jgi:thymidine kinase
MAKLFFRYSSMGAGKSLDLLKVSYNYEENNEKILIFTSALDNRYGEGVVKSRVGLSKPAITVDEKFNIYQYVKLLTNSVKAILVDESQFLTKEQVFQLSDIVDKMEIPVICYGLRSDYILDPFEGSKYLMAISDSIEEIKTICSVCKNKKAIVNARFEDGVIVTEGEQIKIGGNESYKPLCRVCFKKLK